MREFLLIMPEIFLGLTLAFVVIGEITYHGERTRLITATALMGLSSAFLQSIIAFRYGATEVFSGSMSVDGLSFFFRLFFILLAAMAIVMSVYTREIPSNKRAEYSALILAATLGMCLAVSAGDLLLVFLALQFVNIVSYLLAGYSKRSAISNEAAIKYMIFSVVAAALLIYGVAILFGNTHALNLHEIHKALLVTPLAREVGLIVFILIFLAFSFQIGVFPMYLWAPDVLEGAPTPVSAFLALGPRVVGFAVVLRFLVALFAQPTLSQGQWQVLGSLDWTVIVALISGVTMIFGSLQAFRQVGAKRLVACLLVAESGQLLMGLLVLDEVGFAAVLYNLVVELFAVAGIFYVLSFLFDQFQSDRLEDLRGVLRRAVPECVYLILFLLCVVGLPPMPGFFGKFALIGAALRHHWTVLAMVAIISMALSMVAVSRLAFSLIGDFRKTEGAPIFSNVPQKALLLALAIPLALSGVFAETVLAWAVRSLSFILW